MFEQDAAAPVRAVTRRSLLRRRGRHFAAQSRRTATLRTRQALGVAIGTTLIAGGMALVDIGGPLDGRARVGVAPAAVELVEQAAAAGAPVASPPATPDEAVAAPKETGPAYRVVAADGGVFTHGWYGYSGSAAGLTSSPISGVAQTAEGDGYWLTSADGGVFSFGTAPFLGSAVDVAGGSRVVDIARSATGQGYYLVARNGGVFAFGDAVFLGSAVDQHLNRPVASLSITPSGHGYWLVTEDGGVFSFGDAAYHGGTADRGLNSPIIDLVPTPTGAGYYLLSADGGVFAFGDAPFHGSAASQRLNRPIVDMSVTADGAGYWLVASDGGVFTFGAAPFLGTPPAAALGGPVVGIVGGVGTHKPAPVEVVVAAAAAPVVPAEPANRVEVAAASVLGRSAAGGGGGQPLDGAFGWDISYPQCGGPYPGGEYSYAIIGINGGRAFRHNACLAHEWQWARQTANAGVYVNVNFPRTNEELARGASSSRQPECNGSLACVAYNFGWNGIHDSMTYARSQGVTDVPFVWLDVEQLNYWTGDGALNAVVLRGAIDAVRAHGLEPGVYSTPYQYNKIMGGEVTGVPVWTAGADGAGNVARYCDERGFGGGPVALVQLLPGQYDPNFGCPGAGPMTRFFAPRR